MYFMFSGTAAASLFQEDLSRKIQCMLPSSAKPVMKPESQQHIQEFMFAAHYWPKSTSDTVD